MMEEHFQQRLKRRGECECKKDKMPGNFGLHCTQLCGAKLNIGVLQDFFDHSRSPADNHAKTYAEKNARRSCVV
jgi:hypothetical protein